MSDQILESKLRHLLEEMLPNEPIVKRELLIDRIGVVVDRWVAMSDGERMAHQRGMD